MQNKLLLAHTELIGKRANYIDERIYNTLAIDSQGYYRIWFDERESNVHLMYIY